MIAPRTTRHSAYDMPDTDALVEPDLLDRHVKEEGARWSRLLARVLALGVAFSAAADTLQALQTGHWRAMLATRLTSVAVVVVFMAYVRRAGRSPGVNRTDAYARGVMWALATVWAVEVGLSGTPPVASAVLMTVAAFFPPAMRRLGALRWTLGASLWLAIAATTQLLARGQSSFASLASLASLATGPLMFATFFTLGRTFAGESRASAAGLEARTVGRYELVRPIGRGGMGEVWEAHHPALKVSVAIKLLKIDGRAGLARFEAEAQTTAGLVHPSTVRVYDYGVIGGWLAYYVMERVPGKNLRALVQAEGTLHPRRAVRIVRQVAQALYEAHTKRLVHRDIKPENVLVCTECGEADVVKVIDFGLVFHRVSSTSRLTSPGTVLGTPGYLAPEASLGEEATPASDVYSLGCLLYFLLAGRPPFSGPTPQEIIASHVLDAAPVPSHRNPAVPVALDELVARCMSKAPTERPRTGHELIAALDAVERACMTSEHSIRALPTLGEIDETPPPSSSIPEDAPSSDGDVSGVVQVPNAPVSR